MHEQIQRFVTTATAEVAEPMTTPGGARAGAGRPTLQLVPTPEPEPESAPTEVEPEPETEQPEPDNQGSDRTLNSASKERPLKRGENSEYLAARIARDAPEVHEQMKRGVTTATAPDVSGLCPLTGPRSTM